MNKILSLLKFALPVLVALGFGYLADRYASDKLPNYPVDGLTGGLDKKKIAWLAGAGIIGTLIVKFLGRKLHINILK